MSHTVVEVGPATVRGTNLLDAELVSTALEAIDDGLVLAGENVVSVRELWAELMRDAVGDADTVVLVCPSWWPNARIERVREATAATVLEVKGRTAVLQRQGGAAVVEIAEELVVVTRPGARADVIANVGDDVAEKVVAAVRSQGPVLIDAPGPADTGALTDRIVNLLRARALEVRLADQGAVRRAAAVDPATDGDEVAFDGNQSRRVAVLTAVVATTVVVCGGLAFRTGGAHPPPITSTLLVEGRVQVTVPAEWPVEHITSGPGSARAQITSPSDEDVALHLTQSARPPQADLAQTAASFRSALAGEPVDVFVDFNAAGSRAGRTGVTYRELRPEHHIAWTVLLDEGVRIAIGCQSAPGGELTVRDVCDQAIRSAHAIP